MHLRLDREELQAKTMRLLKQEAIELFYKSLESFDMGSCREEIDSPLARKCLFSRHKVTHASQKESEMAVQELDQSVHDVVFVISEVEPGVLGTSSSSAFSSSIKENRKLIETAYKTPENFCLVYIADTERFHSTVKKDEKYIPERGFWVVDEEISIGKTVWEILDQPNLTTKYGDAHIEAATPSVTFALFSTHDMPPESIQVTIVDTLERQDKNSSYYVIYRILTKIGLLQWVMEYRFSEIKEFHQLLRNQRKAPIF